MAEALLIMLITLVFVFGVTALAVSVARLVGKPAPAPMPQNLLSYWLTDKAYRYPVGALVYNWDRNQLALVTSHYKVTGAREGLAQTGCNVIMVGRNVKPDPWMPEDEVRQVGYVNDDFSDLMGLKLPGNGAEVPVG